MPDLKALVVDDDLQINSMIVVKTIIIDHSFQKVTKNEKIFF